MEGIDYFAAEASRGFQTLDEIIGQLNIPNDKVKELRANLLDGKQYLKSDYKVMKFTDFTEWHYTLKMPLLKNVEILYTLHNISHVIKLHISHYKNIPLLKIANFLNMSDIVILIFYRFILIRVPR